MKHLIHYVIVFLCQAVPIPASHKDEVKDTFVGLALCQNMELVEIPKHSVLEQVGIHSYTGQVYVEFCSSAAERRTLNRQTPGSNPLCCRFKDYAFRFSPQRPSSLRCINEYLSIDSSGSV